MFSTFHSFGDFYVAFSQGFVVLKGGFQQIWQSFEMTWRPRDRCGPSMKLALRIFCFPVFYVRAVPCVLSSVHCTYGIRHIRHMAHVLCPRLSCVCIAMFCARTHIWRQGCAHLVAVCFWGNTVLADFPSVVRRGGTVYGAGQYTHNSFPQFSSLEECSMSLLPRQRRRRGISSATGQLPPPLWLAGSGQTLDSGSPLHGGTTNNQHLNAHTLLSGGDPDQWLRWRRSLCPGPTSSAAACACACAPPPLLQHKNAPRKGVVNPQMYTQVTGLVG